MVASSTWKQLVGAITASCIASIPACLSESTDRRAELARDGTRYVEELRSTFRGIAPAAERSATSTSTAPVIGDSIATGYEETAAGLRMQGVVDSEVALVLPAKADGARHLQKDGVSISARLRVASPSPAGVAGGYVLYRDAFGVRTSVIEQARADGVEDFVYFPEHPASEKIVYDLDLEAGVGGLRLVANTLEILDRAGVPRLRINPPFAVGADGAVTAVKLDVGRCGVDTNPAIPSAVRTPPGASSCEVGLSWAGATYPALVDPTWVATTSMAYARDFPASSLVIDNAHVLVTGGYDMTGALSSAEIFDAGLRVWMVTGSMANKRYLHQQVLLSTGKPLVTGGLDYVSPYVASSEEYDPVSGVWINRALMATARYDFPLVLVSKAPVVLGGWSASGPLAACEKYDQGTHTWSAFPSMAVPRGGAAAASSGDNAFVVSGGYNYTSGYLDSSEVYSTGHGAFWAGATMASKRAYHLANPVTGNPRVLITGGAGPTGYLNTAEVYYGSFTFPDPGTWSSITAMSVARMRHQTVNLSPSRVMACGGIQTAATSTRTCEIFDSLTFRWSPTCDMTTARAEFTMQFVPAIDNSFAAGGYLPSSSPSMLSSAEVGGCDHDKCTIGPPLERGFGLGVSSICNVDSFCCSTSWDSTCVREVRTIYGSLTCTEPGSTCGHSLCTSGGPLVSSCDSALGGCVAAICASGVDPYCCSTAWDSVCMAEVTSVCGKSCY